jgi:hypothetical protein
MPQPPTSPPGKAGKKQAPDYKGPKARALMQDCIAAVRKDSARLDRDKADWLNILMYHGGPDNHWVTWDQTDNVWRRIPDDDSDYGLPAEVPRAASNYFRRKIDGIASILNGATPAQEWRPAKDDDEARATAEVVDDALPVLRDEADYDAARNLINLMVTLTDKVAYEVYYDNDEKYGTELIQALSCPACKWRGMPQEVEEAGDTCPQCGAPGDSLEPLLNPRTGEPQGVHYPKGKMCGKVIPSFEFSLPPNARECHEQKVPYILTHTWMAREDAIKEWPKARAIIRNAKSEVSSQATNSQYANAVRNISSPHAAERGVMPLTIDALTVFRLVHDPIEDEANDVYYPEGFDGVMVDGQIIEGGPLPLKDDKGSPMKPIVLRQYVASPGSPFGIPPADDLGVLQRQHNLLETLLLLILLHEASPRTYIPLTVTLEDDITGMPGQTIRYRSNMPGDKPHTDPGVNPPEGLYKALEMNLKAFDDLSGLNAVLEGQHPEGVETFSEVQRLEESGMKTFKAPIDSLIDFEKRLAYLLLQWARQSMWTSRLVRSVGENGGWELKEFSQADLHGSVDVYVNPSSAWPKSQLLQHMRLQEVVKMGAIDVRDPETAEQILSDYDLAHFRPSMDVDKKQIARELDRWKVAQSPEEIKPPNPFVNVALHLTKKANWLKTEEAEAIEQTNPPVWQAMVAHVQQLQQQFAQMQAAQQPAGGKDGKAAAPKPPDKPKISIGLRGDLSDPMAREVLAGAAEAEGIHVENTPPPADPNAPKKADGTVLDAHLKAGALRPALKHPDTLEHHLSAGNLRPAPPAPPAGPNGGPPAGAPPA